MVHLFAVAALLMAGHRPVKNNEVVWIQLNSIYLPSTGTVPAPLVNQFEAESETSPSIPPRGRSIPESTGKKRPMFEDNPVPIEPESVPKILTRQQKIIKTQAPVPLTQKKKASPSKIISKPPVSPLVASKASDSGETKNDSPSPSLPTKESARLTTEQTSAKKQGEYLQINFQDIRDRVSENLRYPIMAKRQGWSGQVLLRFTILLSGEIADMQILSSSGYPILDRQALQAIKTTAPYPVPPVQATIILPVTFELN